MSVASELTRLNRDIASLEEEIAVNTGARAKAPLSAADRRKLKAEMQGLIQKLDELAGRLS
ncbi:MAG: hypothetical protein EOP22_11830 [Hyphomicrobiales bacterium]|nr:MAG: hypothetical protein EOP22_11830 [Hyphomicrobiales bacterium]